MADTFIIDNAARKALSFNSPDNWSFNPPVDDVGIDYWIQILKNGSAIGLTFFIQVKGTENPSYYNNTIKFSISTKQLYRFLLESKPILLVVCDVSEKDYTLSKCYYLWIQDYTRFVLDYKNPKNPGWWLDQQNVTLNLPIENIYSKETCEKQLLPYIRNHNNRINTYSSYFADKYLNSNPYCRQLLQLENYLTKTQISISEEKKDALKKFYWIGEYFHDLFRYEDAIFYYIKSEEILPTPIVKIRLGFCYHELQDNHRAADLLRQAEKQDPNNPYTISDIGSLLFLCGEFKGSYEYHEKAVKLLPTNAQLWANLARTTEYIATEINETEKVQMLELTLSYYKKSLDLNPDDPQILSEIGLVCFKAFKFKMSVSYLERALKIDPNNLLALQRLVRSYILNQQSVKALETIDRLKSLGFSSDEIETTTKMLQRDQDEDRSNYS